jgi:hypothetical protein
MTTGRTWILSSSPLAVTTLRNGTTGPRRRARMTKPILWVSVTSHAEDTKEAALAEVAERVRRAAGDDYNVVVATDKVRLATKEDIERLTSELSRLTEEEYEQMDESADARRDEKARQLDLPTGQEPPQDPQSGAEEEESSEMDLSAAMGEGSDQQSQTQDRVPPDTQVDEELEWDEEDSEQGELDGLDADDVL